TLPADPALRNGNRLIHEQEEIYAVRQLKLLTSLREGLTVAKPDTKKMVKLMIDDLRGLLDDIEGKL
ncbi:hypothetical protein HC928_11165, partial [bacterium]|nr:hypothetical protein [bacterium]